MLNLVKAHAYGNDFLLVREGEMGARDRAQTARVLCDRHAAVGGDGLIVYEPTGDGGTMQLFNADGSRAELTGNGLRCVAAALVQYDHPRRHLVIRTDAGDKQLTLIEASHPRYTFRASMGKPTDMRLMEIDDSGARLQVFALNIGNPHCVLLGALPGPERFRQLGAALERHPLFPGRTNVEFAELESPERLKLLIWERGVGPTSSSGTGTCAAAIAAMQRAGAARDLEVVAPGGAQRVEWNEDGVFLTGWAEVVMEARWIGEDRSESKVG
jgi:diaminopimelate epimerase